MIGCASGLFGDGPVTLSEGLQILVDEHAPLRKSLETLESYSNKIEFEEEKATVFQQLIQEVKAFNENLSRHSAKEEDHLFTMMEKYIGKNGGPIAVMEYEHQMAHGYINQFLQNIESHKEQTNDDMIENANLIKNAKQILLDHFAKEEQVLYPMAEKLLSQDEKDLLKEKVQN
ncbi:hemerythrin domain-containing protein [Calidifontibacillus erzurumensis]|uniref:Hemerythrin domain-containing protein n=1 Tax=Calidifontibacillus erzurumensis TaxID=2741433 RepID=A0A8J8GI49_9BACI|nr:hemerythrin domain-containing protein [Calidifontibacillus erzurumensis]NSL52171.1 hemerythrin domain-containing protein [Calidifontibacillus erzurumensis]